MSAKPKSPQTEKPEPVKTTEPDSKILTQDQHFALSDKEKAEFRANGGTVSNQ